MSDAPELPTGLARITRDLALGLSRMPEFRVGTFGRGGNGSRKLPWPQYNFPVEGQWGEMYLQRCWENFAGSEPGILFTIWDATRLTWLVFHQGLPNHTRKWLEKAPIQKWGYFPLDAVGPHDRLSGLTGAVIGKFDVQLAYSLFGKGLMDSTLGTNVDWMPHGVNLDAFRIHDKTVGRVLLGWPDDVGPVIGCVMTNQTRKDWGLAARIMAGVIGQNPDVRGWWHVDTLSRTWSLDGLIHDYGLQDKIKITITGDFNDEALGTLYSHCTLTMLPSLGEGFGYPLVESLACGVPAIHGSYAAGAELIRPEYRVEPLTYHLETPYNVMRPVFTPQAWIAKILEHLHGPSVSPEDCRAQVDHLNWPNLWPVWKKWFLERI